MDRRRRVLSGKNSTASSENVVWSVRKDPRGKVCRAGPRDPGGEAASGGHGHGEQDHARQGPIWSFLLVWEAGLRIRIHFIRIRIQHFRLNTDPDPDPSFWWPEIEKNLQLKKKNIFFLSKTTIYLSLGLHKGRPSYKRSLQLKREHPTLQNLKFLKNFLLLWVIVALLVPDPDSKYGSGSTDLIESGSIRDPDPQPCWEGNGWPEDHQKLGGPF